MKESYWNTRWQRLQQSRLSRRRVVLSGATALTGGIALGLVGCSGNNNNANKNSAATSLARAVATSAAAPSNATPSRSAVAGTASPAARAATATPRRGGTVTFNHSIEVPNLDVHSVGTYRLQGLGPGICYSRLVHLQLGPDGLQKGLQIPQADAAQTWEQTDDQTYIFHLRPNMKFFNIAPVNGRVLNANDVVYSFQRQRDLKVNSSYLDPIDKMEAVDQNTLRLHLAQPDADFMVSISDAHNKIVAKEAVDAKGDLKDPPVIGTGAFMFVDADWKQGTSARYVRNPDYFDQSQPYLDGFTIVIVQDASTVLSALRTGAIQYAITGGPTDKATLDMLAKDSNFTVVRRKVPTGSELLAQFKRQPTTDMRARQALSKAIDRPALISASDGNGWLDACIILSSDELLPDAEFQSLLARDVAGAKQLLQMAGVSNWSPKLSTIGVGGATPLAEAAQAQLKEAGINATIDVVDIAGFTERVQAKHDFDLYVGATGTGVSTNQDLHARFKTGGSLNAADMSDPQLDQLIDAQGIELKDRQKRIGLLQQIQRRVIDVAGNIPVYGGITPDVWARPLRDWESNTPLYEYYNFQQAWSEK